MDELIRVINGYEYNYAVKDHTVPLITAVKGLADTPPSYTYPDPTTAYPSYVTIRTMTLRGVKKMK